MNDITPISIRNARKRRHGFESLPATERDVLIAIAGVNQRDDPRAGATLEAMVDEMGRWYDRKAITTESVEAICLELVDQELVEQPEPGRFRETVSALDHINGFLTRIRDRWAGVYPDETGRKVVIESRQVAPDYGDAVDQLGADD